MNQNEMIQGLRAEIAKLQRVLDLLLEQTIETEPVRPGRLRVANKATSFNPEEFVPKNPSVRPELAGILRRLNRSRLRPRRQ